MATSTSNIPAQKTTTKLELLAQKEQAAITHIDSFIDTQQRKNYSFEKVIFAVPFSLIKKHVRAGPSERSYIGTAKKDIQDFIKARKHLWKVTVNEETGMLLVQKQNEELRYLLPCVLDYIQYRCQIGPGAKLKDISSMIGEISPVTKRELGKEFEGVKSFLQEYPKLFGMVAYEGQKIRLEDELFINKATLVGDVILSSTDTDHYQSNSNRLESVGKISWLVPENQFGFIKDENGEDVYFAFSSIEGVAANDLAKLREKRQKFQFEAYVSDGYKIGYAKAKWKVFRMWPLMDDKKTEAKIESSKMTGQVQVMVPPEEEQSADKNGNIENDFRPASSQKNLVINETEKAFHFDPMEKDEAYSSFQIQPVKAPKCALPVNAQSICASPENTLSIQAVTKIEKTISAETKIGENIKTEQNHQTQRKIATKNVIEKREEGTQTEFKDDKELLLRLLRQSPDLLKLVQTVRGDY